MIRTQIQLTEKQYEVLKKIAARERVSMAELVRRGVEQVIASSLRDVAEDKKARFKAAAGRFDSGLRDVSRRHDEYLVEAIESSEKR